MTGDTTNGFDGIYGYERSLDGYDDDGVCSGEEGGGGWGLLGEEECKVEDREWSIAVVAAADNANPQPAGSIVLDKTPGVRLMREYESIVVASAASSSSDDDDDGMSIYDDLMTGGGLNKGKYSGVPRATDVLSSALTYIADSDNDNNDDDNDDDGESCNVDRVMSSPSCLDNELSSLMCLNNDELNVFDVDDILVESIESMLAVDDANEGGKDEKDDNDDDADNNDDERSSLSTTVPNATWWTNLTRGRVESRGMMVCIGAASVCVALSVGPGRMLWFADVTLRAHVPHAMGNKLDAYVYDYDAGGNEAVLCWC